MIVTDKQVIRAEGVGPIMLLVQTYEIPDEATEPGRYEARHIGTHREKIPLVWTGDYA